MVVEVVVAVAALVVAAELEPQRELPQAVEPVVELAVAAALVVAVHLVRQLPVPVAPRITGLLLPISRLPVITCWTLAPALPLGPQLAPVAVVRCPALTSCPT